MTSKPKQKHLALGALLLLILGVGYYVLTAPDNRGPGEKIDDALAELPNGLDKAVRQLEDRTPGEKLGDAIKDVGEEIKDSTGE